MASSYHYIVACAHLGNDTGHRIATLVAPLLLTSGPVSYEAVLHSCGTGPVGEYGLVTVRIHGDFIVWIHWNTRLLSHSVALC